MQKFQFSQIKPYFKKKRVLIPLVLVLIFIGFKVFGNNSNENVAIINPTLGTLKKTVQATGQITSNTDLELSFNKQGTVRSVKVAVGDKVRSGQVLTSLESGSLYADVLSAEAGLASAQAKLKKVLEGATNEEIELAKVALKNAEIAYNSEVLKQNTLVENAYQDLLNSTLEAVNASTGSSATPPTISGTYVLGKEGDIVVNVYNSSSGANFSTSGLITSSSPLSSGVAQAIGNSGLYINFPSGSTSSANWIISIPNKKASDYLTNLNAYNSAIRTKDTAVSSALSLVEQRKAELALKQALARPSEIALAEAEVLSAQASLQKAQAIYEDGVIRAPAGGTITRVSVKFGEQIEAGKSAITLQDVENLYVESDINENNISNLTLNQNVEVTVDALPDKKFAGTVSSIDISSEANDGVVNYKIKVALLDKDINIRPGMNAEITILISAKENVLSIPEATTFVRDGKTFVNIITNEKRKKYIEREISVGAKGDGNMVEVLSGLESTEKIALITKK